VGRRETISHEPPVIWCLDLLLAGFVTLVCCSVTYAVFIILLYLLSEHMFHHFEKYASKRIIF